MLTEDYCDFETAKLLKEKLFDGEDCFAFYHENGEIGFFQTFGDIADYYSETCVLAPSLALAMKWLREVYKIIITIDYNDDSDCEDNERYGFSVYYPSRKVDLATYVTYEEACESALKYCLTNLI